MSLQSAKNPDITFAKKPILFSVSNDPISSDAGLLLIRQFDEKIGMTQTLSDCFHDPRDPNRIEHTFLEMIRARVYGILAGYYDQNDFDTLREDPIFQIIVREPGQDLASQPTLSRFENQVGSDSLLRVREWFVTHFLDSFAEPPLTMTFDLDAVDDPTHGSQQLTLFHGYYEQYQYLPLLIHHVESDQLVMFCLRHGTAAASLGADDDLEYLVGRIRERWPNTTIRLRGDCGFGNPTMYKTYERLDVIYTCGQASNNVLKRETENLMTRTTEAFKKTTQPQRQFHGFWYQAESWERPRWIIAKAEAHHRGTNLRFIATNRPGAHIFQEATYDDYTLRGESENRNKEIKCGLGMDRLSDNRVVANITRLALHACAMNLLVRLRREMANPPESSHPDLPRELLPEPDRRIDQNARRRADPLGEGQPTTWRTLIIKAAAKVVVSCRRIVIQLSSSWPHRDHFERVWNYVVSRPTQVAFFTG